MTTLHVNQLVEQTSGPYTGRVWRIYESYEGAPGAPGNGRIYGITLVTPCATDPYSPGALRDVSSVWLQRHTRDWHEPRTDPPQGDGVQWIYVYDGNNLVIDSYRHETNTDMLSAVERLLRDDDDPEDLHIAWFGHDVSITGDDTQPDLYARWVDGQVMWEDV